MNQGDARRPDPGGSAAAVERAFREERAAVLATLIRHVGDFQLAEDAVQDAFAAAVASWPRDGVPANPGAGSPSPPGARRSTGCGATARSPTGPIASRSSPGSMRRRT